MSTQPDVRHLTAENRYVLARGDDRDDALARADRAAELIRFRTADAEALVGET